MQKRIETDAKVKRARYSFDSLADLQRYLDTARVTWDYKTSANHNASSSWDLSVGYEGAATLARDGWIEGAQRSQAALASLLPKSTAPDAKVDFYGYMPHVPRYCAGAPDSMLRHAKVAQVGSGRVLTLYVPITANCNAKAEYMANFGLGVAQYVNQLETDGMRVELYGVLGIDVSGYRATASWCIKRAEQPLDLAVLAFSIGHPAMLRRLFFAFIERLDTAIRPTASYGYAMAVDMADLLEPAPNSYILNGMEQANSVANTPKAALEFIKGEIARIVEDI